METICTNCQGSIIAESIFCESCGFPERGTEDQQRSYRLKISSRKRLLVDANKKISNGRTALLVLAGIFVLFGFILYLANDDFATLIGASLVAIVYICLAIWASKNPFGAMLTGLIIYLTLWAVDILIDPSYIFRGILFKIIIIMVFYKGMKSAREARALMNQIPGANG